MNGGRPEASPAQPGRSPAQEAARILPAPDGARPVLGAVLVGGFFAGGGLVFAVAVLLAVPGSVAVQGLLMSVPPSALLVAGFARSGALTMTINGVDAQGTVHTPLGLGAVRRTARMHKVGPGRFLVREFLLGFGIVLAGVAVCVVIGLIGTQGAVLSLGLTLAWLTLACGVFLCRAAWRLKQGGLRPVESTVTLPLLAAYVARGGPLEDVRRGVPADLLLEGDPEDLGRAARYAAALQAIRRAQGG